MSEIKQNLEKLFDEKINKAVISNPAKGSEFVKATLMPMKDGYQLAKYTQKQVFHENIALEEAVEKLELMLMNDFSQLNTWSDTRESSLKVTKKGKVLVSTKKLSKEAAGAVKNNGGANNRKKNYILEEGKVIEPLVDMGIFTKEGKIVNSMYDKFKQINRFIEIIDDEIKERNFQELNIIDFGCGKSYLTFIVYYYLTEIRGIKANIIGLDLKADVIAKCNKAAEKYGYSNLKFEVGDVNGFKSPFDVDMVITLHACDTATDFALYNAIQWKAKMIFSVPCCQHELNKQIETDDLKVLTRYGIIKERFSALLTDSLRANLLTYSGYRTQLLEFIDFDHTPKNILIRAVQAPVIPKVKKQMLTEVENAIEEFNVEPTLYNLLIKK